MLSFFNRIKDKFFVETPELDSWFDGHYNYASDFILQFMPQFRKHGDLDVMDFGCGDGITALGVAQKSKCRKLVGVDLTNAFDILPHQAKKNLGLKKIPNNLHFKQVKPGPLPFEKQSFDFIYSWSVFEHVDNPLAIFQEIKRLLKPEGKAFIQVAPLYYSPFGSHLQRFIAEPWAHLKYSTEEIQNMLFAAEDTVPDYEKDGLYLNNPIAEVKAYLFSEFAALNRVTAKDLKEYAEKAGFEVVLYTENQMDMIEIPPTLLSQYPKDLLLTHEVFMLLK